MERKSRLIDALENAAWRSGSTFTHELANKRAIRCSSILLPRIEDAALKFRGCFQAICELRSENQQGEDGGQRVVCTSRQGVVVLEPIYPTSLLRHISLSLSLSSSRSFLSFLSLPQLPLTFSPTFTASLRFTLGHPLFALHTEAQRNEQLPLHVLSIHPS